MFDADNGGHAFADVITVEIGIGVFQQSGAAGIIVDSAGSRGAQTGEMGATVNGVDGIGKRINRFGVSIRVLDGAFDADIFDFFFNVKHVVQHRAVAVEIADKRIDPAFKVKGHFPVSAFIDQLQEHFAGHKGHFAEALYQGLELIIHLFFKNLDIKAVGGLGPGEIGRAGSDGLDGFHGDAAFVTLVPDLPIALDFHFTPF